MSASDPSRVSRAQLDDPIKQFSLGQFRSMQLVHMLGYGILLLLLVDAIVILFPFRLNSTWQFEAFGQCIERVPVLFLGLVLVFFGEDNPRARYEGPIVKLLSWFTLILAILLYLMIPLGIFNTIKIDQTNELNANLAFSQRVAQINQVKSQVERATSAEDLNKLAAFLRGGGSSSNLSDPDISQTRQQLFEILKNREQLFIADRDRNVSLQHRTLLKQSFKWNLGAFISGTILFLTWISTRWAR